jgi:NAD dependent epimerase/dehydratase
MNDYWRNQRVLVTGAGGFIGSHLTEYLVRKGAKVSAFVHYNSRADPGLISHIEPELIEQMKIIGGDLRDQSAVQKAMEGVSIVFHLGALISIPYSYVHPEEVVETNILGTLNILLSGRASGLERIIHTSSSEVYGSAIRTPIDEMHPLQGQSPYSASKIGADKLAESFYCAYNVPVVTVRPFNTYGPRQSSRAVIPTIITQALTQGTIHLGNLDSYRDFTFVSDTVEGFLKAAQTPSIEGKTINLGFGEQISIRNLVDEVQSILGTCCKVVVDSERLRPVNSEVNRLISDNRHAKEILGWEPKVGLTEGLSRTIAWISDHLRDYQIKKYQI